MAGTLFAGCDDLKIEVRKRTLRHVLFFTYRVILGEFDSLVGFDARLAQPLAALHAETNGAGVVFTAGAYLRSERARKRLLRNMLAPTIRCGCFEQNKAKQNKRRDT